MFKRVGICIINCIKIFKNFIIRIMYIKKYYKGVINKNWFVMELLVFINRYFYLYCNYGIIWNKKIYKVWLLLWSFFIRNLNF